MTTVVRRLLMARPWLSLACWVASARWPTHHSIGLAVAPFLRARALVGRPKALGIGGDWCRAMVCPGPFCSGHVLAGGPLVCGPENVPLGLVGSVIGTPIAVLGIPAVIALCFALPVGLTIHWLNLTDRAGGWFMVLLIALAWACGDWLRSWVLTGLPWNLTAYVWGWSAPMMQSVAWIGPYGLSFLTALVAFAPLQMIDQPQHGAPLSSVMIVVFWQPYGQLYGAYFWVRNSGVRAEPVNTLALYPCAI